jgi:trans-2-enoyl-CoA reductase
MLRAQYERRGPVPQDVIEAVEFEAPPLVVGQVLLEVVAAPINPSDLLTLTGEYGDLPALPAIGGREGVGRVAELGPDASEPAVGQLVLLPRGSGTWSTHVVAVATQLQPLPHEADPLQLSMMTINPPTAALLLSEFVSLQPGEWVIQNAANSAVGLYLVQLARYRGYRTVNVVRREDAADVVQEAGGDVVLLDGEDLTRRVAAAIDGAQIRLGIDAVAGAATGHLADCLCERDAGQLRPHERRAVWGATGRSCLPRPDAARLLAGEMVSARARGGTPGDRRRDRRADRLGQAARTHPSHLRRQRDQGRGGGRSDRRAIGARSSSSRDAELWRKSSWLKSPSGCRSTSVAHEHAERGVPPRARVPGGVASVVAAAPA